MARSVSSYGILVILSLALCEAGGGLVEANCMKCGSEVRRIFVVPVSN
jgi:hypothetical protein